MKKKIPILIGILWILLVVAFSCIERYSYQSTGEYTADNHNCMNGNDVYITENFKDCGYIYRLDTVGRVTALAGTDTVTSKSSLQGIASNGNIYAIFKMVIKTENEWENAYQLVKYDSNLGLKGKSKQFYLEKDGKVTNLTIENDSLFLCQVSSDGSKAYAYKLEDAAILDMEQWDNQDEETKQTRTVETVPCSSTKESGRERYFSDARYANDIILTRMDDGTGASDFTVSDQTRELFSNMIFPIKFLLKVKPFIWGACALFMIGGCVLLALICRLLQNRKRMIYLATAMEAFLLVVSATSVLFTYQGQKLAGIERFNQYAQYYLQTLLVEEENFSKIAFEKEDFYQSNEYIGLQNRLANFSKTVGTSEIFQDVCVVRLSDGCNIASTSGRNQQKITEQYTSKASIFANLTGGKSFDSGIISIAGRKYGLMAVAPDNTMNAEYALFGITNISSLTDSLQGALSKDILAGAIAFLVGSLVCGFFLIQQSKDLNKLEEAMQKVAYGKSEVNRPNVIGNDMETMWSSLYETDKTIKQMNYSKYRIFEAYYRFAPKRIEDLLAKSSITDVVNGDISNLSGTMAMISVDTGRREVQNIALSMNRFLDAIEISKESQNGIFVSNDCNLSLMKLFFPEEQKHTVQFGIDLIHKMQSDRNFEYVNVCLLLHYSEFSYGVTGSNTQSFTFLKSNETSKLESYMEWLRSMTLRLVLTEEMLLQEYKEKDVRYLGFIAFPERTEPIKLYEVLEACPENERLDKLKNKEKFDKALNLFYQHDFYLARSTFSEILRDMPKDQITKWYLFTCEKYLNEAHSEDVYCGLGEENR